MYCSSDGNMELHLTCLYVWATFLNNIKTTLGSNTICHHMETPYDKKAHVSIGSSRIHSLSDLGLHQLVVVSHVLCCLWIANKKMAKEKRKNTHKKNDV